MAKKYNVTIKIFRNGSAGLSDSKVAHVYIGKEYYASFALSIDWSYRDDKDFISKQIESAIFYKHKDTNITFSRGSRSFKEYSDWTAKYTVYENEHLPLEEVFSIRYTSLDYEHPIKINAMTKVFSSDKVTAEFRGVDRKGKTIEVWYNDLKSRTRTEKSFKPVKNPKCEKTYDKYVGKIASGLENHIEDKFSIKIKITGIPTYSEFEESKVSFSEERRGRTTSGTINFKFKIIDHDNTILMTELSNTTVKGIIDNSIIHDHYDYSKGRCIIDNVKKSDKNITLHQAMREFNRSHHYFHKLKEHEDDFIEDPRALKSIMIKNMVGWAHNTSMNTRAFYNLRSIMPEVYRKMFGELHPSTIPCVFYMEPTQEVFDRLIEKHELPKFKSKSE